MLIDPSFAPSTSFLSSCRASRTPPWGVLICLLFQVPHCRTDSALGAGLTERWRGEIVGGRHRNAARAGGVVALRSTTRLQQQGLRRIGTSHEVGLCDRLGCRLDWEGTGASDRLRRRSCLLEWPSLAPGKTAKGLRCGTVPKDCYCTDCVSCHGRCIIHIA